MNARSIKAISLSFFVLLLAGLFLGGLVIRSKHLDQANQIFQGIIPDAQQFLLTYQTIDPGLRLKTSNSIFEKIKSDNLAQTLYILDQHNLPLLMWQKNTVQDSTLSPNVVIPDVGLRISVMQSNLPGAARFIVVSSVLSNDELASLLIVAVAALGLFLLFLIIQLVSRSEKAQPVIPINEINQTSQIVDQPIVDKHKIAEDPADETPLTNIQPDSRFLILNRSSGVTKEDFLNFRLDKELERSAENAIDMSVAMFKFLNLQESDHTLAAKLLLAEFSHEDLIFESGKDTFCVILPQHDLDQGIARADLLIRKCTDRFATIDSTVEMTAGLSSRNGRLLDSPRFIREAQIALRKANAREGRIVGFRPDPVRFRNFLRYHRV